MPMSHTSEPFLKKTSRSPTTKGITQAELRDSCGYDPATGNLIWIKPGRKRVVGLPVGSLAPTGYIETCINRKRHLVHRLVWLWHHGEMPMLKVDHINRCRTDNRIENLRLVDDHQNCFNQSKRERITSSKWRGVSWCNRRSKWKSAIVGHKKYSFVGYFPDQDTAAMAYNERAAELYGQFAALNEANQDA